MTPVRVGVLGCADIAVRRVLPAFVAAPGVDLVAVASRDARKAARVAGRFGCQAITGYQSLLDRDDIEAVYVPLPAALHAEWTFRALAVGKHVLCEKPLTPSAKQTAELLELAASSRLVLRENFMFQHHHQHQRVRELIGQGAIGELRGLSAAFTVPPRQASDIRLRPELGGGALLDVGVYPLRVTQLFLGTALAVLGAALRYRDGVDVAGAVLLRDPDGVTAQLTFGMEHSYRADYQLWGSEGSLTVGRAYAPPADHRPCLVLERSDGRQEIPLPADDQYAKAVASFAAAVRSGDHDGATEAMALAHLLDGVQQAHLVDSVQQGSSG